jgi:MFS family permease
VLSVPVSTGSNYLYPLTLKIMDMAKTSIPPSTSNPVSAHSVSPASSSASSSAIPVPRPIAAVRPRWLLPIVLIGQFMALLDVAIVNVAAPTIQVDLKASGSALQLVISGYTITYAVLLITGARLGERWGFGRVFQAGLALFTLASLACGLAPNVEALVGFRLLQGVGSALMVPQVMSLIQRTYVGPARTRALGAYTMVLASGLVVGQVLGGLLVTWNLFGAAWRPVFLVNVPIGIVLLVIGHRVLPVFEGLHRELDLAGLITLTAAVMLLVVPLTLGHEQHWPAWGWAMMAASGLCLAAFGLVERRIAERGGSPLIRGRVIRSPGLAVAVSSMFLIMAGVGGFMFAFALYLQSGLGQSALRVGLTYAPMALGFGVAGLLWRRLPVRIHPRIPFSALLLCAIGYAVLGRAVSSGGSITLGLELMLMVMGALAGCAYGQLFASALSGVRVQDAADASGVVVTLIQLGNVVGVATIGTLFLSSLDLPSTAATAGYAAELAALGVAACTAAAAFVSLRRPRIGQV